jgi:hypothetical protein
MRWRSRRRISRRAPPRPTRPSALMPLTFAMDQGVPRDAAGRLRALGSDGRRSRHSLVCRSKKSVVVTLDADCHAILAVSGAAGPSVIRIRIQGLRATEMVDCLRLVLIRFESEIEAGALLIVKPRKTTCHRLPIGQSQ